ncbi:MAG TPA: sugar transferase [Segeticoccus sp.]|uniref:sugar transferase n=1 Tax=Segeticoccus sp. TaxID=2706531 RepID=UPI002D80BDE8|nr:sugar transferase [Segeticoccus sp.]HET8599491.1 sugar transferase [Segeticoccus sp.]
MTARSVLAQRAGTTVRTEAARVAATPRPEPAPATEFVPPAAASWLRSWAARFPRFATLVLVGDITAFLGSLLLIPLLTRAHVLFLVLMVGSYAWLGLYRARITLSVLDDIPQLLGGCALAVALSMTVAVVKGEGTADVGLLWRAGLLLAGVLVVRVLGYALLRALRRAGLTVRRVVVVGTDEIGLTVARRIQEHPEHGLRLVGFVDADPPLVGPPLTAPLLGGQDDLAAILQRHRADVAVVGFLQERGVDLLGHLRRCAALPCEVYVVPRLMQLPARNRTADQVWGVPLLRVRQPVFQSLAWPVKRLFDVLLAAVALLVTAPVLAVAALAVRLEGGPGVIFRQERVGLDGRPFTVLKLRSLKPATLQDAAERWSISDDERMGPVGRFIRTTSIDELPQLFNVLRGDMSIVGPRPERPYFVEQFAQQYPDYLDRHRVPVGLTGYAAVNGLRGDTSIAERVEFDNLYIESWSLWLDAKIFLRTFAAVLRGDGS